MPDIENRKIQHIQLAKDPQSQINIEPFSGVKLPYKTLPDIDMKNVDTSTDILGKKVSQPLIIASMTGGTSHAKTINTNLAIAINETNTAMGVGSQRIALTVEDAKESFRLVRRFAPKSVIFANMGAVQLNYGKKIEDYKNICDMIEADGLFLHINGLQEALQPEGDTNFKNLIEKIHDLVEKIGVAVFVKEVGHGIDKNTAELLLSTGIAGIDIAGVNGTSWAWIEAKRRNSNLLAEWFKNFGITTEESLDNVVNLRKQKGMLESIKIVASGGIRNPIQGLKARLLGTDYYSAAKPFLESALEQTPDNLIKIINEWQLGLKIAMFGCGFESWDKVK